MEKAYDTTWGWGILRTLHNWGFRGHLPFFVKTFQVTSFFEYVLDQLYRNDTVMKTESHKGLL
jgi:hypothetical protein